MLLLKLILERHVRAVELGERIHCIRMVRAAALALPTTPSPPRKVTHEYYIRGEGEGDRGSGTTNYACRETCAMNSWYEYCPPGKLAWSSTRCRKKTGCRCGSPSRMISRAK